MELIGDAGVTVIWVGEQGVRFYASGSPLTHKSQLLMKQAELVSNQRKHLAVVRKMYLMRFPNEDVSKLTLQQLRGREGARIRMVYKTASEQWKVPWGGRCYKPDDITASNAVNQALTIGHSCLYGLVHAVIVALGCSPGLGFVHVGHERSFVYDIADLYKAEITIPLAFEIASEEPENIEATMRHATRDKMHETHLLSRIVRDIKYLLNSEEEDISKIEDTVFLWDNKTGQIENGHLY